MLEEVEEILNSKDNARASLALKKIFCQKRPPPTEEMDTKSLAIHIEKHFISLVVRVQKIFQQVFYN